jgi:hypothetical protein
MNQKSATVAASMMSPTIMQMISTSGDSWWYGRDGRPEDDEPCAVSFKTYPVTEPRSSYISQRSSTTCLQRGPRGLPRDGNDQETGRDNSPYRDYPALARFRPMWADLARPRPPISIRPGASRAAAKVQADHSTRMRRRPASGWPGVRRIVTHAAISPRLPRPSRRWTRTT